MKLKRQIRLYTPVVPSKSLPDSRRRGAKCIPVFRPKRPKNLSLGQHILPAYLRESGGGGGGGGGGYPLPPPPPLREFVPRSVPIVFLLTVNRICLAVTLLFAPKQVYIFLFRGKIQLLKHGEFTLGDSDMILIIMTSLLNI